MSEISDARGREHSTFRVSEISDARGRDQPQNQRRDQRWTIFGHWGGALSHPTCWGSTPGCVRPGGAFDFRISMVLRCVLWTRCFWLRPSAACPAWRSGCSSTGPLATLSQNNVVTPGLELRSLIDRAALATLCPTSAAVQVLGGPVRRSNPVPCGPACFDSGPVFCPRPRRTAF